MNCKETNKLISYYIDGECTPELREKISGHIAQCAECKKDYILLSKLSELFKQLPEVEPSRDYYSSFEENLVFMNESAQHHMKKFSYLGNSIFKFVIPAVAAMFIFLAGLSFFLGNRPSDISSPKITYVKGEVSIMNDNAVIEKAYPKMFSMAGKTISTGNYGKIDIVMQNRFKVSIGEKTEVKFDEIIEQQNQYKFLCTLRQGKFLADVNNRGVKTDFRIRTNTVNVRVRGTQFMVNVLPENQGNNVEVAVLDGKVEVTQEVVFRSKVKTERYYVNENEKMIFSPDGSTKRNNELSSSDFESLLEVYDINKRDVEIKYTSDPAEKSMPFRSESFE